MFAPEPRETEQPESEPMPIDTTAELLGRATARPKRARAPRAAAGTTKRVTKKPAAKRATRSKKAAASDADDQN